MNTINPKYTRNIEQSLTNDKNNYLYNKNLVNSQTKSNGNALKLYKKVDEDLKVSSLIRIVNPFYRFIRKVTINNVWNRIKKIGKKDKYSDLNEGMCLNEI